MERSAKKQCIRQDDGMARGASCTQTSTEVREMAASPGYDYEVFLSFRGPDTRSSFTDFLYIRLDEAGIRTFKDDEELRKGEEFAPQLLQAINQSKISIPIFSKNYASSPWCLKEVAQMVKNKKDGKQKIMPIFYDVAPSEVRYQSRRYKKAFRLHDEQKRYDKTTIDEWKAALSAVGGISGWDLHGETNRQEGRFAKALTHEVLHELKKACLEVSDNFVRMDNQVDEIMKKIDAQASETRIVGIYGMGGSGKTTIAKFIYNQLVHDFEYCCFLPDIREKSEQGPEQGIPYLQNLLISTILPGQQTDIKNTNEGIQAIKRGLSNKKVLLLLDDVGEKKHMNALINEGNWLGNGSKVIITTRNKDILEVPKVCSYELKGMNHAQSLQLFSRHAFRKDDPLDEYIHQSEKVIDIAQGLPLTIEVIGSLLSKPQKDEWDGILEELKNIPPEKVKDRLKISYDALNEEEKFIFRDISCLFIGYDKDILIYFWDASELGPKGAIKVLQNMCLIKINEDNTVWMHDQLRDLGRDIVRRENIGKPEKQSRVWDPKKGWELLRKRRKGDKVEALRVKLDHPEQYRVIYEGFESLPDLRFLEVDRKREMFWTDKKLPWDEWPSDLSTNGNSDLLPELRWLSWPNIPPTFNLTNFSMAMVVILNLSGSNITHDWEGWSHMKVMENLKVLDLSECRRLKRTPDFSAQAKLERLILRDCHKLEEIDGSICHLKSLVSLDAANCWNLRSMPDELGKDLASLKYLSLGYSKLKRLPNTIGKSKSLIELDLSRSSIEELPDSIEELKNLKVAKMGNVSLSKVPNAFWMMKLDEINVSTRMSTGRDTKMYTGRDTKIYTGRYTEMYTGMCSEICHVKIDNGIYGNKSLRILSVQTVVIKELPRLPESLVQLELEVLHMGTFPDLSNLTNLNKLTLRFANPPDDGKSVGLMEVPISRWIGNLSKLEYLSLKSFRVTSTEELSLPPQLTSLNLESSNLRYRPRRPSYLSSFRWLRWLRLFRCESLCLMEDLSNLEEVWYLEIVGATIAEIQGLGRLWNLQELDLRDLRQVKALPDPQSSRATTSTEELSLPPQLKSLKVESSDLRNLPKLPSSLSSLSLSRCKSFCSIKDLSNLKELSSLQIEDTAIAEIQYLGRLENLDNLDLRGLGQVKELPDLSNLNKLWRLHVEDCPELTEIRGVLPESLYQLCIDSCGNLQKLPDPSSSNGLRAVAEIQGLGRLENLRLLELRHLGQLKELPDLSNLKKLRRLVVERCGELIAIQGVLPESLAELQIYHCGSLQKLPDPSSSNGLRAVAVIDCEKCNVEAISRICLEKSIPFQTRFESGEDDE